MVRAPLTGIRVIELGNYMAGPYCAMQLADLGADVIKVENPSGGDMSRQTAPFIEGESSNFFRLNRNKRSIALDLKAPDGKAIFRKLAAQADILVENLRPGTMRDLELDYDRIAAINPGIIYVSASGFGQTGPYAELAGLDIIAQGMSGLMSITGEPDGGPLKVGVPITDLVCALYGALAAVSALHARGATGRGQWIDISLFESGVSLAVWEAGKYFATGEIPGRLGTAHQTSAPYQALRSSDGSFLVGATSPRNWEAFCRILGIGHLRDDPRFNINSNRTANRAALIPLLEEVTMTQPMDHWLSQLQAAGVPSGRIQDYGQVFNDPHLAARKYFVDAPHATAGAVRLMTSPMNFSETPTRIDRAGPLLGEHSAALLREFGYDEAEITRLLDAKVIEQAHPEKAPA